MGLSVLLTPAGRAALEAAAPLAEGDELAAASTLRRRFDPTVAAIALTQARLRVRARAKFGERASGMFFTRAGLEQATRPVVAARRAARLLSGGVARVADLGCGIGSDLFYLRGTGIESDRQTALCASLNVPSAQVIHGDVRDFNLSTVDAAFCDPARRTASRRIFDPADYSPPWDWLLGLVSAIPRTVLKLAPGIDQEALPAGCELELVSVDGEVVEAAAWCGPLAEVPRRATVIRGDVAHQLTGTGLSPAPVGQPAGYIYDPDGAVVRSHLVASLAEIMGGVVADPTIAYVWSDRAVESPFGRCFAVDEVMPFSLKRLRAALRARGVGRLEILKRGSPLSPDTLRSQLKLSGDASASLLLTRVAGHPVAVIATPVPKIPQFARQ
ncbi:MAG TPA: hypothetical protein VFC19_09325 [Candidatus Limnocylindrales bacterium]|nr:hypothetical protein [Candidatus Limnocylindrales bacterium]